MKRTLKRVLSVLLAAMMLVGCLAISAFAVDGAATMDGSSNITIHSAGDTSATAARTFRAYQIFYGDAAVDAEGNTVLSNVKWGVSIKGDGYDYATNLLEAVKNSGNANLEGLFERVDANSYTDNSDGLVEVFLEKIYNLGDDTETTIAFTQAVSSVVTVSGYKGVSKTSSPGEKSGANGSNYIVSGLHQGYYLLIEEGNEAGTAANSSYSRMILRVLEDDVTADIKTSNTPDVTKIIKESKQKDSAGYTDSTHDTASIGETKTFLLRSTVPDMTGYQKYYFVFNDTMSAGINYDEIKSVKIYNDDETITLYDKENIPSGVSTTNTYNVEVVRNAADNGIFSGKYETDKHGTTELAIIFNDFIQYKDKTGYTVEIEYTGYLNQYAIVGDPSTSSTSGDGGTVVTTNNAEGNPNSVYLTYSNNPNVVDNGDANNEDKPGTTSPVKNTETKTVYLYTAGVDLIKVNGNGHRLEGATFKITGDSVYTILTRTQTYTPAGYLTDSSFVKDSGTTYYLKKSDNAFIVYNADAGIESTVKKENVKYKDNGSNSYSKDLENGGLYKVSDQTSYVNINEASAEQTYEQDYVLYTMTETTVAENKTENKDITVTVGTNGLLDLDGLGAGTYLIREIVAPSGYNILEKPITLVISFTSPTGGSTVGKWEYTAYLGEGTTTELVSNSTGSLSGKELRIVNKEGSTLPSTGGIGTTIFYVVGGCLVVGAGVLLISKKRMNREDI